jgi:hypothetical protein
VAAVRVGGPVATSLQARGTTASVLSRAVQGRQQVFPFVDGPRTGRGWGGRSEGSRWVGVSGPGYLGRDHYDDDDDDDDDDGGWVVGVSIGPVRWRDG